VSDDASVEAGVKKVLADAGKIDVLVNNAGIASVGVIEAVTAGYADDEGRLRRQSRKVPRPIRLGAEDPQAPRARGAGRSSPRPPRRRRSLAQSSTLRTTPLSRLSAKRVSRSWYAASAKICLKL
jgi:NAD(P)-dependent dehydrogenase (short-subunit alcohol dehydrogenase family)